MTTPCHNNNAIQQWQLQLQFTMNTDRLAKKIAKKKKKRFLKVCLLLLFLLPHENPQNHHGEQQSYQTTSAVKICMDTYNSLIVFLVSVVSSVCNTNCTRFTLRVECPVQFSISRNNFCFTFTFFFSIHSVQKKHWNCPQTTGAILSEEL